MKIQLSNEKFSGRTRLSIMWFSLSFMHIWRKLLMTTLNSERLCRMFLPLSELFRVLKCSCPQIIVMNSSKIFMQLGLYACATTASPVVPCFQLVRLIQAWVVIRSEYSQLCFDLILSSICIHSQNTLIPKVKPLSWKGLLFGLFLFFLSPLLLMLFLPI